MNQLKFAILFIVTGAIIVSCGPMKSNNLKPVKKADLTAIDPELFQADEWFYPYYLEHFSDVANSVVDTGSNRGYFDLSVWRGSRNHHTYNARVMEGILSLVWFYCTDKPWNIYYKDKALKKRIEASLEFWCSIQHEDGRFSEYGVNRWSLAPTAFATKFVGRALWLLNNGPGIDTAIFERSVEALRKALYVGFTHDQLWQHGRNYTNQFANLWGGALLYLELQDDPEIDTLLRKRLRESMTEFQSDAGFFYEKGGPDWGYNLSTHHSDLQVAWEFADEEIREMIIEKTREWYEWFAYNAILEPGTRVYYLNRAIETRQQKGFFYNSEVEDPAYERWSPQSEFVPAAWAFEISEEEFNASNAEKYREMLGAYPAVADLQPGEFNAFTPYAFLHHDMQIWHPTEAEKTGAIAKLPYLKDSSFIHVRFDDRSKTTYSYVRKSNYYVAFNGGGQITDQQRFGIGLVWNPEMGTVIQSQSRTDQAAWGTCAEGEELVYEGSGVEPSLLVDGNTFTPEQAKADLDGTVFQATYPLGDKGFKSVSMEKDRIRVTVNLKGKFQEFLPLLIGEDDSLNYDSNTIQIQDANGVCTVSFKNGKITAVNDFESDLTQKSCRVIKVEVSDLLEYLIEFRVN